MMEEPETDDPRERVLDFALSEVLRGSESRADAILAALVRGEKGTYVEHDPEVVVAGAWPAGAGAAVLDFPVASGRAVAAAVLLAFGLGVSLWRARDGFPLHGELGAAPFARADRALEVARDDLIVFTDELLPGDRITAGRSPVRVTRDDASEFLLEPRSEVVLRTSGPQLMAGSVRVTTEAELELEALGHDVHVAPGTELVLALARDVSGERSRVTLRVETGAASWEGSKGGSPLASGETLDFAAYRGVVGFLDPARTRRIEELGQMLAGDERDFLRMWQPDPYVLEKARFELDEHLANHPEDWYVLDEELRDSFANPSFPRAARTRMLAFLARSPSELGYELARDLWMSSPESFGLDTIVTLAERGAFEFDREVRAIKRYRVSKDLDELFLPLAYLALRKDAEAVELLDRDFFEAQDRRDKRNPFVRFLVAEVLRRVGRPEAVMTVRAVVSDELRLALERDDLALAGRLVLLADYFGTTLERSRPLALGSIASSFERFAEQSASRVASRAQITELALDLGL